MHQVTRVKLRQGSQVVQDEKIGDKRGTTSLLCCSRGVAWEVLAGTLHLPQGTYSLPLVHHADAVECVPIANTGLQASLQGSQGQRHSEIGHRP